MQFCNFIISNPISGPLRSERKIVWCVYSTITKNYELIENDEQKKSKKRPAGRRAIEVQRCNIHEILTNTVARLLMIDIFCQPYAKENSEGVGVQE